MSLSKYTTIESDFWTGRVDDETDYDSFRWHQIIKPLDLGDSSINIEKGFCMLGFCCDKGVELNLGRPGASQGPNIIRKEMCNLPCSFSEEVNIYDAGNISYGNADDLVLAQELLGDKVFQILNLGLFPIVLGGGHETAFGHYLGLSKFIRQTSEKSLGILNFDAHFDMRPYDKGTSSGTMFAQIADICKAESKDFNYMVAGIQQYGNTVGLFKKADSLGVEYLMAKDITTANMPLVLHQIKSFAKKHEYTYLTICSDVISAAYAPGVSAPQPFGLHPDVILQMLKESVKGNNLLSFDIAEVSPRFDEDNRTAKLAAIIVFSLINALVE